MHTVETEITPLHYSLQITASENVEAMVGDICKLIQQPWTLVLHHISAALTTEEVEKTLNLYGAKYSRILNVCSTLKAVGTYEHVRYPYNNFYTAYICMYNVHVGDVQLGTVKEVVIGFWGKNHPPVGHILSEGPHVNSVICFPQEENTMVSEEGSGWIHYLCMSKPKGVVDIFGESGETKSIV